jgi:ribosomal protein S18 acetylase RimI-like enzyme
VLLEVRQSNEGAQSLYEAAGFVVHGERRGYYGDGEAALEMRLELPAC